MEYNCLYYWTLVAFALIASIISQGILQVFNKDITMLVYAHKLLLRRLNNK